MTNSTHNAPCAPVSIPTDLDRQREALRQGYDGHLSSEGDLVHYDPEHDPTVWSGKREPLWARVLVPILLAYDRWRGL